MERFEQIQKLLQTQPDDVFLNYALALEYVKGGRYEEAVAQFDRVNEIDPDYIPAWFQKGTTLATMEKPDEARKVLQHGIAVAERTGDHHAAGEMREAIATLS
jgi:tetratricopeptide (TPR) repeat protein